MEVKNIKELIQPLVKDGQKLVSYGSRPLLSAGENYGSIMLQIEIKLSSDKNEEEVIHCVGKACPPKGFLWDIFNPKVSFKKEIALYTDIVPALNAFGREKGVENLINFVCDYCGSRISLDPLANEVDENAVLLLENLKMEGFDIDDRFVGFDLESSKLILSDLATLHASVIAYKLAKPDQFKANILPYLHKHIFKIDSEKMEEELVQVLNDVFSKFPECVPHIPKVIKSVLNMKNFTNSHPKSNKIFTTLTHNDYWVNNTMLKCENGKAIKNKMVDFQMMDHSSLANDVLFFLYTSVDLSLLENRLDDLIIFYYEKFIETLKKLEADVSPYTFEALVEEFSIIGKETQFMHILTMLRVIMILKDKAQDVSDMEPANAGIEDSSLHENYYKKMRFTLMDFVKRKWL